MQTEHQLTAEDLSLGYLDRAVVERLSLSIPTGGITALIGANGSGKSTILKAMARVLKPTHGAVFLDGKAIHQMPTKQVARRLAMLPQAPEAPTGLTVRELVSYGRFPHTSGFGTLDADDHAAIAEALRLTQMDDLGSRPIGELSGGQRQRAWIAMALAQQTPIMLLDEPTTYLDMGHQLEVLQLLERLHADDPHRTTVVVVHDLNHASRYAHHVVAILDGAIAVQGTPTEVMTHETLRHVFGVEADIIPDPRSGLPLCIPFGLSSSSVDQGLEPEDDLPATAVVERLDSA